MIKKLFFVFCLIPVLASAQQKITIIPGVGYAWRTAKLSDQLNSAEREYGKQLTSGMNFEIGAYYRFNDLMGLGLRYNLYTASASGIGYQIDNPSNQTAITTDDKITFIGPAWLYSNFEEDTRHKLFSEMGVGLLNYNSKTSARQVKGFTLGVSATAAYMYAITPNIYIGPQFSFTTGVLKKIKENGVERTLEEGSYEGLSRVAIGAGITFRL